MEPPLPSLLKSSFESDEPATADAVFVDDGVDVDMAVISPRDLLFVKDGRLAVSPALPLSLEALPIEF